MKCLNSMGLSKRDLIIALVVAAGLLAWGSTTIGKFIEHTRATEAENTINLAANAQGRQLMSRGYYAMKWNGMDLGPLSVRVKKVGDYLSRDGKTYFTRGGADTDNPRGFKIQFDDGRYGFFIVAKRINSRYSYELVRKLPEETVYCVPQRNEKLDIAFCVDFMSVSDESQLPRDPRLAPLSSGSKLWN